MGLSTKNKTEPETYATLSQHPKVAAARAFLYQLHSERDALSKAIDAHYAQVADSARRRDAAVDALLAKGNGTATEAVTETLVDANIGQLQRDLSVRLRAIERQRKVVLEAESEASREIRQAFVDKYRACGREIARALEALQTALSQEVAIQDELDELGVTIGYPLQGLKFHRAGDLTQSRTSFYFIDQWMKENQAFIYGEDRK